MRKFKVVHKIRAYPHIYLQVKIYANHVVAIIARMKRMSRKDGLDVMKNVEDGSITGVQVFLENQDTPLNSYVSVR